MAGGGGYYGGSGGYVYGIGGGGGSGYVKSILMNTSIVAGNTSMPTKSGQETMIGNSGNGYAKITLVYSEEDDYDYEFRGYTGDVQTYVVPETGTYKLEVWGAQGGINTVGVSEGGKGGYSAGEVYLEQGTKLYIYVGETPTYTGTDGLQHGGFNGGGSGYASSTGRAGGGATDIRINNDSLYARAIVAGGGGGYQNSGTIGVGGGLSGTRS